MRVTRINAPLCGLPLTAATLPPFKRYRRPNAFLKALENHNLEIARILLQHSADSKSATATGNTPLILVARTGMVEIVQELLNRHADPNVKDSVR